MVNKSETSSCRGSAEASPSCSASLRERLSPAWRWCASLPVAGALLVPPGDLEGDVASGALGRREPSCRSSEEARRGDDPLSRTAARAGIGKLLVGAAPPRRGDTTTPDLVYPCRAARPAWPATGLCACILPSVPWSPLLPDRGSVCPASPPCRAGLGAGPRLASRGPASCSAPSCPRAFQRFAAAFCEFGPCCHPVASRTSGCCAAGWRRPCTEGAAAVVAHSGVRLETGRCKA